MHHLHIGKYFLRGFILIIAVILVDQYTKWLVVDALLRENGPITFSFTEWLTSLKKIEFFINEREQFKSQVISPFLNIVIVWNQGISFGILDNNNSPHLPLIFIAVSLVISAMLTLWMALATRKVVAVALGLVIGGALANILDRIRFDAVVDFIDVHIGDRHWPAFNVADSCIVLGAFLLILSSFAKPQALEKHA